MMHALLTLPFLLGFGGVATTSAPVGDNVALTAALDQVAPSRIRADLSFLASDDLRGRNTPSPELRIAALFLRSRVQALGFGPGAENGWFYDYPLHSWKFDTSESYLRAGSKRGTAEFVFASDYYFMLASHARNGMFSGDVICVGQGREEELAGLELKGRWALLLDRGLVPKAAAKRCMEAGAMGVIMTPGPEPIRRSYAESYQKRSEGILRPGQPLPSKVVLDEKAEPWVMLDRAAGKRLFACVDNTFEGEFPPLGHVLGVNVEEKRQVIEFTEDVSNVCAFWPGSDPDLAKEVMIVSAHYDHVGVNDSGEVFNGADDNASGTSGLLALADALVTYGPLKRSVLLMWVSGEEKGLWGSATWTKHPWLPEGCKPMLDINIDMIGRTEKSELYITPSREHDAFNSVAEAAYGLSELEGFPSLESQDEYWRRSDHMNFNDNLKIPVVFLSSGEHPDYHKVTDTFEKIDYEKMSRVVRLVVRLLDNLQDAELTQ